MNLPGCGTRVGFGIKEEKTIISVQRMSRSEAGLHWTLIIYTTHIMLHYTIISEYAINVTGMRRLKKNMMQLLFYFLAYKYICSCTGKI